MYRITQTTEYSYSRLANHSISQLRLFPLTDATQACLNFDLEVNVAVQRHDYQDYWDNHVTMLYIHEPHTQLTVRTTADVEVSTASPFADAVMEAPSSAVSDATRHTPEYRRLYAEYLAPSPYTTLGQTDSLWGETQLWQGNPDIVTYADELSHLLFKDFKYSQGSTTVAPRPKNFSSIVKACARTLPI